MWSFILMQRPLKLQRFFVMCCLEVLQWNRCSKNSSQCSIFYFHPYLGMISILTNIFQRGWNHQLGFGRAIPSLVSCVWREPEVNCQGCTSPRHQTCLSILRVPSKITMCSSVAFHARLSRISDQEDLANQAGGSILTLRSWGKWPRFWDPCAHHSPCWKTCQASWSLPGVLFLWLVESKV